MENTISINSNKLQIKEYNGLRIVTFKDIDTVHGRPKGTAHRNFKANRNRFIEGVDYFMVKPADFQKDEIRPSEINNRGTVLITESGYLMLVKSFTDDLAWTVQRELVNNYFRVKAHEPEQLTLETSEYHYFLKTFQGKPVITIADFEHFTGVNRCAIRHTLNKYCKNGVDFKLLDGDELLAFKIENISISKLVSSVTIITKSGVEKLLLMYNSDVNVPLAIEKKAELTTKEKQPVIIPSEAMKKLMGHIQREAQAIEGISHLLLCYDTKDNLENYRRLLNRRIEGLRGYCGDIGLIKIGT